jgi:hypothetical protein
MDVESEIRDLKRRVGELEGGFGFLTQQVRAVHLDLLGLQKRTEERFDKVEDRLDRVENRLLCPLCQRRGARRRSACAALLLIDAQGRRQDEWNDG